MPGVDTLRPLYVGFETGETATITNTGNVAVYYQDASKGGTISASVHDGSIAVAGSLTLVSPTYLLGSASGAQVDLSSSGNTPTPPLPVSALLSGSWLDLCRAPYNCVPGTDITTALQAAVNLCSTANTDGNIYASTPGVYLINGAVQTGTAFGYSYAGQILFPARDPSGHKPISIRIMGMTPPAITWAGGGESPQR